MTDAERARYLAILGRPVTAVEEGMIAWMEGPCPHGTGTAVGCPVCWLQQLDAVRREERLACAGLVQLTTSGHEAADMIRKRGIP